MDYRGLLAKYIKHVGEMEGVDFLGLDDSTPESSFTPEEWAELKKISKEVNA